MLRGRTWIVLRRPFDFVAASLLLVILSPIMIVTALLVRLDGGPAMFMQPRAGFRGKEFQIFKFRSMIVNADQYLDERGMPTRNRLTRVGNIIRKTSIDEFPQLFNVILGDMAMIGPRPILPHMISYMTEEEKRRFSILPGITGWAQVKGRNLIPWSRRFELDAEYVDGANPMLDLQIVFLTALRVLSKSEIVPDRNADVVDDITTRSIGEDG